MSKDISTISLWDVATAVATTGSITSDAVSQHWSGGSCSLLVILSGTSPSVNITYTVGNTNTDIFYSPVDRDNNSLNALGSTVTATRWISFSPVIAPFIKIIITGDGSNGANTTARAYLFNQEDF